MNKLQKNLCEQIEIENKKTQQLLCFQKTVEQNFPALLNKIIDTALLKYKNAFMVSGELDNEKYMEYLETISKHIQKSFFEKDVIELEDILTLHSQIFSIYEASELESMNIKSAGMLRDIAIMSYNLDEEKKLKNRNYFTPLRFNFEVQRF